MAGRTIFTFEDIKIEQKKLELLIGNPKAIKLEIEVKKLEDAIRKSDINEFDVVYKSIGRLLTTYKAKAGKFLSKLKDLNDTITQGKGRGNPMSLIKVEGDMPVTEQQDNEEKKSRNDDMLTSKTEQLKKNEDELNMIKTKLYNACTKHTDTRPPTPKTTQSLSRCISETGAYADILIDHLEMKNAVKGVKEAQAQGIQLKKEQGIKQEAKYMLEKVNSWLKCLREQVENGVFDETAFKSSTDTSTPDEKKTRKNIEDICVKLKNKSKTETAEHGVERQQIASDIDALEKETNAGSKRSQDVKKQDNSMRIQNLVKQLKKEKDEILDGIRAIYKSFSDWRTTICKEKKFVFDRKTSNMISETDAVKLLSEVSFLQEELFLVTKQEEEAFMQELQELKMDIENEWDGKKEVEKPKKWNEGPRKDLRNVRLQFLAKTKTLLSDSKKRNEKEDNKRMANEQKYKEYIKIFWSILFNDKPSTEMPTDTTSALVELENIMTEITKKLNKTKQEEEAFMQELQELKLDIENEWNGKIELEQPTKWNEGPRKDIRNVRLQFQAKTKTLLSDSKKRNEKEHNRAMTNELKYKEYINKFWSILIDDKPSTEMPTDTSSALAELEKIITENTQKLKKMHSIKNDLEAEIKCILSETDAHNWNNPTIGTELKINKNTPQLLVDVSEIKKNLKERKEEANKKEKEMRKTEHWIKGETTKLWRRVTGAEHVNESNIEGAFVKMFSDIQRQLQTWEHEREDLEALAGELNNALSEIKHTIKDEPFTFTDPKPFDEKAVVKNTSTVLFYPVKNRLAWIIKCLKKNQGSFAERYVKMEVYSAVLKNENILSSHVDQLESDKSELLNRLSKLAGARLTDNNPSIADLSDPNRATKLGEKYSELYDNAWTDALEALNMSEEKQRIDYLLDILVVSYQACREISVSQQRTIVRALVFPSEVMSAENLGAMKGKEAELSAVQSRTLVELRKQSTDLSVNSVKKYVKMEHKDWFKKGAMEKFTIECIDLCWLMHVQSPPVCIDTKIKPGSKFDSNSYKSFTKNGKKIDYLVWPALLLHEKGSVVCKGVAQLK